MKVKCPKGCVVAQVRSGISKRGNAFCFLQIVIPDLGLITAYADPEGPFADLAIGSVSDDLVLDMSLGFDGSVRFSLVD